VRFWSIILFSFIFNRIAAAQDVGLVARTDSDTFAIGSWIDVHVDGRLSASVDSIVPAVRDSAGPFEVISVERERMNPKWVVRLMTIDSGKVFIPPIPFDYKLKGDTLVRTASTNSLLVTVTGVAIDPKGEIKDIKPPLYAPWLFEDFLPYAIGLFVIALLAAGYYYYRMRIQKKKDILADVKVVIPPHTEAFTALRVLEEKKLWQQGFVKEYYSEVTEIIRRFFEKRWSIIALELTTDEILLQMKHIPEALAVWKQMESFFLIADLVKFAKYQPSPAEHENELRTAYDIVRAMIPITSVAPEQKEQEVVADVR
jgi:hypothetical protein